jgi:hypothetical protein
MKLIDLNKFRHVVPVSIDSERYTVRAMTMQQLIDGLDSYTGYEGIRDIILACSDIPAEIVHRMDDVQLKVVVGLIRGVYPDEPEDEESKKS